MDELAVELKLTPRQVREYLEQPSDLSLDMKVGDEQDNWGELLEDTAASADDYTGSCTKRRVRAAYC